jgi:hypothetical protein
MSSHHFVLESLQNIPDKKFELNLISVTLTCNKHHISGCGRIFQDADGHLILDLINAEDLPVGVSLHDLFGGDDEDAGYVKLFGRKREDSYFDMSAIDENDNLASCKRVSLERPFTRRTYRVELMSKLIIESSKQPNWQADDAKLVFRNRYKFSTNDAFYKNLTAHQIAGDDSKLLRYWKQEIDGFGLALHRDLSQLRLHIKGVGADDDTAKRFVDALDFAMAQEHQTFYEVYAQSDSTNFKVVIPPRFNGIEQSKLMAPYGCSMAYDGDSCRFNHLIMYQYYLHLKDNPNSILPKWHTRLYDAGTGYLFRYILTLSIAVEALLGRHYPIVEEPKMNPKTELDKISELAGILNDDVLVIKLKALVENVNRKQSNYPTKRKLKGLTGENKVSIGAAQTWDKARGKLAHGEDYNDDMDNGLDTMLDLQTLYYEIVFSIIGYQGEYVNFFASKSGTVVKYPIKQDPSS